MECRSNSSENIPLLQDTDWLRMDTLSYLPLLPKDILGIILSQLSLHDAFSLMSTSRTMNKRVKNANSPYTFECSLTLKSVNYTYSQVITVLNQIDSANDRIEEIEERNNESCYYVPQEDLQCTQWAEFIVAVCGVMTAGLSCGASLVLSLTTPVYWPLLACGTGNAAAACPIGIAASSRFYTSRFHRENREIAHLHQQIDETEKLKKQISSKDALVNKIR